MDDVLELKHSYNLYTQCWIEGNKKKERRWNVQTKVIPIEISITIFIFILPWSMLQHWDRIAIVFINDGNVFRIFYMKIYALPWQLKTLYFFYRMDWTLNDLMSSFLSFSYLYSLYFKNKNVNLLVAIRILFYLMFRCRIIFSSDPVFFLFDFFFVVPFVRWSFFLYQFSFFFEWRAIKYLARKLNKYWSKSWSDTLSQKRESKEKENERILFYFIINKPSILHIPLWDCLFFLFYKIKSIHWKTFFPKPWMCIIQMNIGPKASFLEIFLT